MSTTGSLRGMTIAGVQYRVPADADVELKLSPFEVTAIATSGETMFKMEIISPDFTGIPLSVSADEAESLKDASLSTEDISLSLVMADQREYKAQGRISFDTLSSMENKAVINAMPNNALGAWELF